LIASLYAYRLKHWGEVWSRRHQKTEM
jgi:hypothetical protein